MNKKSVCLAAFATIFSGAAVASAFCYVPDEPLRPQSNPLSCSFNGSTGNAFSLGASQISANIIGGSAAFADSFGYNLNGGQVLSCIAKDQNKASGVFATDTSGCQIAVRQDLSVQ